MRKYFRELSVAAALLLLLSGLALGAPSFFHPRPLLSLLASEAPAWVVGFGMALVIISRQIDISVGSQFGLCSVCAGLLAAAKLPLMLVVSASLGIGLTLGALNGLLVAGLRLPSIVVTLAAMVTWREALRWKRHGEFVNLPEGLQWMGLGQEPGQVALVVAAAGLLVLFILGSRGLAAGRFVYAVGSDAEAARLAGIRPQLITFGVFALLGLLTGLAAVMNLVQSPQVDPKSGTGLELRVIAGAVVGGISISGGRGTLWGAFLGMLLLACISPALVHLRVEAYWERAIQGAIILLAVIADGVRHRKAGGSWA